jgi:hypothetical protein
VVAAGKPPSRNPTATLGGGFLLEKYMTPEQVAALSALQDALRQAATCGLTPRIEQTCIRHRSLADVQHAVNHLARSIT